MGPLLSAIASGDAGRINAWATDCEQWATVEQLIAASGSHGASASGGLNNGAMDLGSGQEWTCAHCTLVNPAHMSACDACTLPR